MFIHKPRLRMQPLRTIALVATTFVAVASAGALSTAQARASAPQRAGAQSTSEDSCRFMTADAMGKAFGRAMKSTKIADICDYRGAGSDRVVVKVTTGPEGTILRHVRTASAQADKAVEKVATPAGEAYIDSTIPVFIGRVGNREVQIETTIEPMPREALKAVGIRVMEMLGK